MHQLSLSPASTRSVCPCVPVGARVFPCVPVCVPRRAPSAHAVRLCDSRARRATALARCATARPSPPPLAARPWPPSRTRLSSLSGPKTASSSIASSTRRRCCSCGLRHCRRRRRIQCRGAQRGCWPWPSPPPPRPRHALASPSHTKRHAHPRHSYHLVGARAVSPHVTRIGPRPRTGGWSSATTPSVA